MACIVLQSACVVVAQRNNKWHNFRYRRDRNKRSSPLQILDFYYSNKSALHLQILGFNRLALKYNSHETAHICPLSCNLQLNF